MDEIIFDELNGEEPIDNIHIDRMLYKVSKLEREIEELEQTIIDSEDFYNRRIRLIKEQITARVVRMETYALVELEKGHKTCKMPSGTLRITKRTKKILPEDDDCLINYSYANNIETNVKETPDKKGILKYIKESGVVPDGYREKETISFSYKTN
jgi:hypothetical protein